VGLQLLLLLLLLMGGGEWVQTSTH
jgi:hypothetical protein